MDIDWVKFVLLLVIPYVLFGIAFYLRHIHVENWIIRKFIHTVGLFVAALYGAFIDSLEEFFLIIIVLLITLLLLTAIPQIRMIYQLLKMGTREGEHVWMSFINTSLTTITVIILRLIFVDSRWIFLAAVLSVAFGDGLGEFIGRPYGNHKYKILAQKSLEGSIAVFVGSVLAGIFSALIFNELAVGVVLVIIIASAVVTVLEGISMEFIDNIIMPIVYSAILWFVLIQS